MDVLDRVPPSRLRATARTELVRLESLLASRPAEYVADLRERLRTLPPPVAAPGPATTPGTEAAPGSFVVLDADVLALEQVVLLWVDALG
jgi:hypothetical protein